MAGWGASVYAFVEDARDDGVEELVSRVGALVANAGVAGLTVAAAYHQARDLTPHGTSRLTWRRDGVHLVPDADLFTGSVPAPPVQPGAEEEPLRELRAATASRGMELHAWTVFLHNVTLGLARPDLTIRNCFGDSGAPADLCPANPDVRRYAVGLGRVMARRGVESVVAESLHYGALGHGYHHERVFVALGALDAFCLGVCFCAHCCVSALRDGVDADAAAAQCRAALEPALAGESVGPDELSADSLAAHVGADFAAYVDSRKQVVTSLVAEVAAGVRGEGARLVVIDLTGAAKGYASGEPAGGLAADDSWWFGLDLPAVAAECDGLALLAYARDAARVGADVEAFRRAAGDREVRAVLRPGIPDADSAESLISKVKVVRDAGASAVDFYAYGLAPQRVLDRIPVALG